MKNVTLFTAMTLLQVFLAAAQEEPQQEKIKKNAVAFEFYEPIDVPFRDFEPIDNFGISPYSPNADFYSRNSSRAYGLSYERLLKNDIVLKFRIGVSKIAIENRETSGIYVDAAEMLADEKSNYTYDTEHFNLIVGAGKRINLTKTITVDFGLNLAAIFYGPANSHYYSSSLNTDPETQDYYLGFYDVEIEEQKSFALGFGPYIKPELTLWKSFFIAAELQVYYLRGISGGEITRHDVSEYKLMGSTDVVHTETTRTINRDYKLWDWSKISPVMKIGYKF
jgi:hypothetical protein